MKPFLPERYKLELSVVKKIKDLQHADNWHNFIYIFTDYILIVFSVLFAKENQSLLAYIFAILVIGSRMNALDNLSHEASHNKLFKNQFLNYWISMIFCYFPLGMSPYFYDKDHIEHHRYLGDPVNDPDRVRHIDLGIENFPTSRRELFLHFAKKALSTLVPICLLDIIKPCFQILESPRSEQVARRVFWLLICFLLTALGLWKDFISFWLFPFAILYKNLGYLAEISEHAGLYKNGKDEINLARNNFCHPILQFFLYPHSDSYHLTHHILPAIPHYNIKLAHTIILKHDVHYQQAHHCYGYFLATYRTSKSTLGEMISS